MTRVVIADDHPIVRQGLQRVLATERSLKLAAQAADGWEVLEKLRQTAADLLLTELMMPGPHGPELIRRVKIAHPKLAILVFSRIADSQVAAQAIRAGAAGYITKESYPGDLIVAIRRVAAGGRYIHPSVAEGLVFDSGVTGEELPHHRLSDRETQVFLELTQGKAINDIALSLHVTAKTVSTHKMRIMRKLGVKSTADLMRYAFRHGLAA